MRISYLPSIGPEFTRSVAVYSQDHMQLANLESRLTFKMFEPYRIKSGEKSPDNAGFVSIWAFPKAEKGLLKTFRYAYSLNLPSVPLGDINRKLDRRSQAEKRLDRQRQRRKAKRETRQELKRFAVICEKNRRAALRMHKERENTRLYIVRNSSYHYTKLLTAARNNRSTDT